jgi:hypothetical protein
MKKIILLLSYCLLNLITKGQQDPTNNSPSAPGASGTNSSSFWSRVGNAGTGANNSNNIFGTLWDSPIYTYTSGLPRTKLNGNLTTTVNSVTKSFAGYFGISPFGFFNSSINTPYSMLHLDGPNNVPQFGGGGWRQWMNTGTFMRENSDAMYVGLMEVGSNRSDAIINWSDDVNLNPGPDKLRFIFTGANTGNGNGQTDPRDPYALNGYEFMRMTTQGPVNALNNSSGHIGIGPLFTDANFPRSRVHMHAEDNLNNYLQISVEVATGIGQNDGTRLGVLAAHNNNPLKDGNALLYNQEDRHLLFSTGNATPNNVSNSRERVRITHIGAPTDLTGGGYGIHDPWGIADRFTRMSVSRDPNNPAERPMATFHVGYSYSSGNNFGWRNWMDQGMLVVNNTENHMYFGFNPETANNDAIVSWGKNQTSPERLRFIYSSTAGSSAGADGLEITRMWSDGNEGRMGVGDFFTLGIEPQNTVHINSTAPDDQTIGGSSGLRFEDLTSNSPTLAANPGLGVLSVDANGDVIYVPGGTGGVGAQICNTMPTNNVSKWTGTQLCQTQIWDNGSRVGIDVSNPTAKLSVFNGGAQSYTLDVRNSSNQYTIQQLNSGATGFNAYSPVNGLGYSFITDYANAGSMGFANGMHVTASTTGGVPPSNIHAFQATVTGDVGGNHVGIISQPLNNLGGNTGFLTNMINVSAGNTGLRVNIANSNPSATNFGNYITLPSGIGITNYGIYSSVPAIANNWAGFFQGNLNVNGTYYQNGGVFTSDQQFKTNINDINDANSIIEQLQPREFYFDTTNSLGMNFSSEKQYGLIAQEVENILPELVGNNSIGATLDSLGNIITPAYNYKTLNYNAFIGILLQAQKESNQTINNQDSMINSLQEQINTLHGMITSCCNNNSNTENNSINQNPTLDVTLSDNVPSIVLDQNVPNPFAEQTTITYTLTEGVKKAQMLFYNIEGKLIQAVELSNTFGKGQMNVFANDLSTGVYTYTLVVDGEIKGTKRMVKE